MGTDNGSGYQYDTTFRIDIVIEDAPCVPEAYGFTPVIPSNYDIKLETTLKSINLPTGLTWQYLKADGSVDHRACLSALGEAPVWGLYTTSSRVDLNYSDQSSAPTTISPTWQLNQLSFATVDEDVPIKLKLIDTGPPRKVLASHNITMTFKCSFDSQSPVKCPQPLQTYNMTESNSVYMNFQHDSQSCENAVKYECSQLGFTPADSSYDICKASQFDQWGGL